ncbi:HTH_Tnp_Tc3_2 domain-containing protein [Trichonephila clavipes]|nr:HTH_Tnp_Tc3_2 domain-containing protein [Trichonephila clavipes]
MGRRDAAIRRCWQEWVANGRFQRHDGNSCPRATADRYATYHLSLYTVEPDYSGACIDHADWGRIVFSDKSRFQLCLDNHRRCVWRHPGQRADPAFTIARHTCSQPEVMDWSVISFDNWTDLVVIRGNLQHSDMSITF